MKFIPAGEIIGSAHQVRTVTIAKSPELLDGEYSFVDTYCTDSTCDCRKTMIQVLHNGECVSIINFGWEKPSYYEKWMGGSSENDLTQSMHGSSIDITSPNRVNPDEILGLFNTLLNEKWIGIFKQNYTAVKARSGGD